MEKNKNTLCTLAEVCKFLKENDNFLILTHSSPDGDTLGSAFALLMILQKLSKKAKVVCPDEIPGKYGYFTNLTEGNLEDNEQTIIAVDVADNKLLGSLKEKYGEVVDLAIDHHRSNTLFAKKTYLDADAAANCECIYNIAKELSVEITKELALCLYTGISTDTGCFRFSNTTANTLRIGAALMETGIDTAEINRVMFETKSRVRIETEKAALEGMEFFFEDKCALITVTRQMYEQTGAKDEDLEGITTIPRSIEGVLAGITLREKEDGGYKISVRTYPPVDASKICGLLGGGGHIRAAGCQINKKYTLNEAKQKILDAVKTVMEEDCAGFTSN